MYGQYLNLYAKKKQPDRIMEICRTAYDAYPDSWPLTYLTAVIAVETTQSFPSAIAIIHSYLRRGHSDANALYSLGEYQLRSSDLEGWENTYRQLMDLDPASTGYIYQMSKTYLARRDLAAAETSIRNALPPDTPAAACPW